VSFCYVSFYLTCLELADNFCFYLQNRLYYSDTPPLSFPCFVQQEAEDRKWRKQEMEAAQFKAIKEAEIKMILDEQIR
jgi:hypothetical protein